MTDDPNNMTSKEDDVVAKVIIHIPTEPEISFICPVMFKMPEVGQILDLAYENFITDPDQWKRALSILENDVMVIDRIEGERVYLRKGNPAY
ncbi:hypothetical protein LV84_02656 [Algoriphagus ratkowskyi]|uniref:Uncharacterized protein n=1 Tax=Algoriphagus ratkowskyi TaxID=57028 RepID=A0A2W7RIY0_9BACT|nr:hypothetical protein [Algoriphagus ratkowskyi]PZX55517.1 hypothetical protein LV84_02656 [Algoriphagus ratkowskyi]TXD79570.1 hypothetical protein ESW18_00080 [Algoriphagus ratkowskyi]